MVNGVQVWLASVVSSLLGNPLPPCGAAYKDILCLLQAQTSLVHPVPRPNLMRAALTFQRSFSLQQTQTVRENHNRPQCRAQPSWRAQPQWTHLQYTSCSRLREHQAKRNRKMARARGPESLLWDRSSNEGKETLMIAQRYGCLTKTNRNTDTKEEISQDAT